MADTVKAPTAEVGSVVPAYAGWGGRRGAGAQAFWDALTDDVERVLELRGQAAIRTYDWMLTDAQVAGIMLGIVLPLMRYDWTLRPNNADTGALERFADDMGLGIEGSAEEPDGVDGTRFDFHEHLRAALRMLRYGYMPFEQVAYVDDDGWQRYRKLAERPPRSVLSIDVASDGGLASITQEGGTGGNVIGVDRLVMYSWDREGARWAGTPILRPAYKNVLIKDRLLRVDALKHERNGMGIPTAWAPPNATNEVMLALQEITSAMKAGEESGMALPPGSDIRLLGTTGSIPDTIRSVEYHDQQISKAGLAMVLELGMGGNSGNRALGNVFDSLWVNAMDYIASAVCNVFTRHVIRDWFAWNMGPGADVPLLVAKKPPEPNMAVDDFRSLVDAEVIRPDRQIEDMMRKRYRLPARVDDPDEAATGKSYAYDLEMGVLTIDDRRAQLGKDPRPDGLGALTVPEYLATIAGLTVGEPGAAEVAADAITGTGAAQTGAVTPQAITTAKRRAEAVRFASTLTHRDVPTLAAAPGASRTSTFDAAMYPEHARRQPFDHEVKAATDFTVLDELWDDATGKLVKSWMKVRTEQSNAITKAIAGADGDVSKLAVLDVPDAGGTALLRSTMLDMADSAAAVMADEAKRQGVKLPRVNRATYEDAIAERAETITKLMATDLANGAAKHALRLTSAEGIALDGAAVAELVGKGLAELSDAYLHDQLGHALTTAQNTGRFAAAEQARVATRWYASELLDTNTCSECASIDGTGYASMEEAAQDYPTGGYINCAGRERCRGTIVVVYDESAPAIEDDDVDSEPGAA